MHQASLQVKGSCVVEFKSVLGVLLCIMHACQQARPSILCCMLMCMSILVGDRDGKCHDSDYKLVTTFREGCPSTETDVQCALWKQGEIQKWLDKHNTFKVLITGKTGTGKTTLIRGLKENYFPKEEDSTLPHTIEVTPYSHNHKDIDFVFFDTPGLKDKVNSSDDYSYLKQVIAKAQKPHMIIFVMKMDDNTFQPDDIDTMRNISDAFGSIIWENTMFALTFANKVYKSGVALDSIENRNYYEEVKDYFSLEITKKLREFKVKDDIANGIPVVPIGLISEPHIKSDGSGVSWINEFWVAVKKVMKASRPAASKEKGKEARMGLQQ